MGREWYFNWGTKSSSKIKGVAGGGGGAGKGGERKVAALPSVSVAAAAATAGGCMNAVFHMFDFHQFRHSHDNAVVADQISPNNVSKHHGPIYPKANKGVEAPRNSLESLEDMVNNGPPSLATIIKEEKNDNAHILERRDTKLKLVQTPRNKPEEQSSSETARTPNLVARLMGLDILPESITTPRSSTSQQPIRSPHVSSTPPAKKVKTRISNIPSSNSVPAGRKSTANYIDQHRLSLQINKENSIVNEMESSRPSCSGISTKKREGKWRSFEEEQCRSPSYYARQIMKQVKETISRRVGVDITNTIEQKEKDRHLLSSNKPKKPCSYELDQVISNNDDMEQVPIIKTDVEEKKEVLEMSYKKVTLKSLDRNKKDEQFVRGLIRDGNDGSSSKKCNTKRMMPLLSSDLFHGSRPSFVPFKKDSPCSSPSKFLDNKGVLTKAKPWKNQTSINISTNTRTSAIAQLSKIPSQRYMQKEVTHTTASVADKRSNKDTSSMLEFQYISRILKCVGIDKNTPLSFTRWFSPSHLLDPSIFHNLETTHYLNLNYPPPPHRKLIFHLVDEILADLLNPSTKNKPWTSTSEEQNSHFTSQQLAKINRFQLVKTLCTRIRSFPSRSYQTLDDIDALVVNNMSNFESQNNRIAIEKEVIVLEIECEIVNSLVQEIAMLSLVGNHINSIKKYISPIRI